MSDKYYRGIRSSIDDTKYKLQLASMTLKINENKNNINGIKSDISGINNFSEKINTNENDISNNLRIIDTNKNSISSNLGRIDTNKNNISSNLGKIDTNKSNISSNLNQIHDIKPIFPKLEIFKKTFSIKNQSFKFDRKIIYFKLLEIDIENNFNIDGKLEIDSNISFKLSYYNEYKSYLS